MRLGCRTALHKPSGRTAFEELKMVRFTSPVLQFGESVIARRSGVPDNRLSSGRVSGLWLGRSTTTNEHIVGTASGIRDGKDGEGEAR